MLDEGTIRLEIKMSPDTQLIWPKLKKHNVCCLNINLIYFIILITIISINNINMSLSQEEINCLA
jgi:hypothetical protein